MAETQTADTIAAAALAADLAAATLAMPFLGAFEITTGEVSVYEPPNRALRVVTVAGIILVILALYALGATTAHAQAAPPLPDGASPIVQDPRMKAARDAIKKAERRLLKIADKVAEARGLSEDQRIALAQSSSLADQASSHVSDASAINADWKQRQDPSQMLNSILGRFANIATIGSGGLGLGALGLGAFAFQQRRKRKLAELQRTREVSTTPRILNLAPPRARQA